jgi:hypothetical protein
MEDADIALQYLKNISDTQQQQGKNIEGLLVSVQKIETMTSQQESRLSNAEKDINCLNEFKDNVYGGAKVFGILGGIVVLAWEFVISHLNSFVEWIGGKV